MASANFRLLGLDVEVRLAETELAVREALLASERAIPDASRDLSPAEIAAGVKWAQIDRAHAEAVAGLVALAAIIRRSTVEEILATISARGLTPVAAVPWLTALLDPTSPVILPETATTVEATVPKITDRLLDLAADSAEGVIREAAGQGVSRDVLPRDPITPKDVAVVRERLEPWGRRIATRQITGLVQAALEAGSNAGRGERGERVLGAAMDSLTDRGVSDLASQAAGSAQGLGRYEGALITPTPRRIISSELLDRSTCVPCTEIDGKEYGSLGEAYRDYPLGPYRHCAGGARCRGTLVFIWDEAEPSVT